MNKIDPYGWFQEYFRFWSGSRTKDNKRQINRWKKIVSRFRSKLVKMIRDVGRKFDAGIPFRLKLDKFIALGLLINRKYLF